MKKIAFLLSFLFLLCLPGCAKSKPVEPLKVADGVFQISPDAYQERFNSLLTDGLKPIKELKPLWNEDSSVQKAVLENSIAIVIWGHESDGVVKDMQLSIADDHDIVRFMEYAMCVFLSCNPTAANEQKQEFKKGLEAFEIGIIYEDLENNVGYSYNVVNDNMTMLVNPRE